MVFSERVGGIDIQLVSGLFQTTLTTAYDTTRPYTRNVRHRACVFSFIALMCVICHDLVVQYPFIDSEMSAINARCLMAEALNGEASFELAQAATTLVSGLAWLSRPSARRL